MWVEDQPILTMHIGNDQFEREYRLDPSDAKQMRELYTENLVNEIRVRY